MQGVGTHPLERQECGRLLQVPEMTRAKPRGEKLHTLCLYHGITYL